MTKNNPKPRFKVGELVEICGMNKNDVVWIGTIIRVLKKRATDLNGRKVVQYRIRDVYGKRKEAYWDGNNRKAKDPVVWQSKLRISTKKRKRDIVLELI